MTLQKALLSSLSTAIFISLLLGLLVSSDASAYSRKKAFDIYKTITEKATNIETEMDLTTPAGSHNKKDKLPEKKPDITAQRRHADEDKHENHHHHFDRIKSKKKAVTLVMGVLLKIFVAISYFSILLCGYMSLSH